MTRMTVTTTILVMTISVGWINTHNAHYQWDTLYPGSIRGHVNKNKKFLHPFVEMLNDVQNNSDTGAVVVFHCPCLRCKSSAQKFLLIDALAKKGGFQGQYTEQLRHWVTFVDDINTTHDDARYYDMAKQLGSMRHVQRLLDRKSGAVMEYNNTVSQCHIDNLMLPLVDTREFDIEVRGHVERLDSLENDMHRIMTQHINERFYPRHDNAFDFCRLSSDDLARFTDPALQILYFKLHPGSHLRVVPDEHCVVSVPSDRVRHYNRVYELDPMDRRQIMAELTVDLTVPDPVSQLASAMGSTASFTVTRRPPKTRTQGFMSVSSFHNRGPIEPQIQRWVIPVHGKRAELRCFQGVRAFFNLLWTDSGRESIIDTLQKTVHELCTHGYLLPRRACHQCWSLSPPVKTGGLKLLPQCSVCHLVSYCDAKCQKSHWPLHKLYCSKRVKK